MEIQRTELERVFKAVLKKLKRLNIRSIALDEKSVDMYWSVGPSDWIDMNKSPELQVGSLVDDWKSLQRDALEDSLMFLDFDRLASILNYISEELNPIS